MDAIEKYEELKELITTGAKLMGINIMNFNFKPSFLTFLTLTITITFDSCMMYTFFRGLPNILDMLRALTLAGIAVATTYKFIFIFSYREDFYVIVDKVDKLYRNNAKLGEHRVKKLIECLNICKLFKSIFMFLYSNAVFLFLAFPIYSFVFKRELKLPIELFLPKVNENTTEGFIETFMAHLVFISYGLIGITSFDISFMTWTYHFVAFVDMLKFDFQDLEKSLKCEIQDVKRMAENRRLFAKILKSFEEITEYSGALNDFFASCCLYVMAGAVFSITVTLFIVLFDGWHQGYGIVAAMFGQILVSSILGTILLVQHDRIMNCINDFPWYMLTVSQQRDYVLLILQSQKSPQIEMMFMGGLNVETFVTICNTIYSYFTMMVSFM